MTNNYSVLVETCLDDLFLSIIDENNNQTIDFIHEEKLIKKSDRLPFAFEELLSRNNLTIKDISSMYVTKGPGSFMGVRAGLIYTSSIAQILNITYKVVDTMTFISGGIEGTYHWDAKSKTSYKLSYPSREIEIVEAQENSFIDYKKIIKNPNQYLELFEEINPSEVEANYVKEPKIG